MRETPLAQAWRAEKRSLPITLVVFVGLVVWAIATAPAPQITYTKNSDGRIVRVEE